MVEREPETKLSPGFSSDAAVATEWAQGRRDLEEAECIGCRQFGWTVGHT